MTDHPTLASALAEFQATLPTVVKGNTARIPGKEGKAGYAYEYADLTDVSEAVLPALAKVGLSWHTGLDTTEGGQIVLRWALMHGMSNEELTGTLPVGRPGEQWQSLGSSITYARRYALVAATGVAPGGDDNDGAGASAGSAPVRSQERPPAPSQRPQAQPRQAAVSDAPAGAQRDLREALTPTEQTGMLPDGLYTLSAIVTAEDARKVYRTAQRAGHLGLTIADRDLSTGEIIEIRFGDWLEMTGNALAASEAVDS